MIGRLASANEFSLEATQRDAWRAQIDLLQRQLAGLAGFIAFEFSIPRMGRRIDVVLLIGPVVFVIEFKVGERAFDSAALEQVWDYALDLKNFHEGSHAAPIVPMLVATEAKGVEAELQRDADGVYRPLALGAADLRREIERCLRSISGTPVDAAAWLAAPYHPTPTIIEAARALYGRHSVEEISRSDAGARNLRVTSRRVEELAQEARETRSKRICFVTGVPGAGKTLVGLNVATRRRSKDDAAHAVYLSGNGPLVDVLREALTRDEFARRKAAGESVRKGKVVFVPPGDAADPTRSPAFYDATYAYLASLGIPTLQ